MIKLLKRVTSHNQYISYIDGLRFISIFSVICFHFFDYYRDRVVTDLSLDKQTEIQTFTTSGFSGVMLFFGISGFVLGMPFIKQYLYNGNKVSLKQYLLKRLTRLEPPYILVLTVLFILSLIVGTKGGFYELLPHYLASLFYSHNIIYDGFPVLSDVFWSLEIEVQFYLLAPILTFLLFKLNKKVRWILFAIIILFYTEYIRRFIDPFSFKWIIKFIEYFIAGIFAAELYFEFKDKISSHIFFDVICFYMLCSFWFNFNDFLPLSFKVFILIATGTFTIYFKKILSYKYIPIIGGMCYTIYMIHQRLLYFVMGFLKQDLYFNHIALDVIIRVIIYTIAMIVICVPFYLLIERPTMKKDWWKIRSIKKLFLE